MAIIPDVFSNMIQTNIRTNMTKISGYDPMAQENPIYFTQMCQSIGRGIAASTTSLSFTTSDNGFTSAPLVPPGVGTGSGIIVDQNLISKNIYNSARDAIVSKYGGTMHDSWPPKPKNSGEYLKAISDGIAKAVKEHFAVAWTLNSTHTIIYSGSGQVDPLLNHKFTGIMPDLVGTSIQSFSPNLKGEFWPDFCNAIAKGYADGVMSSAKANVTIIGVCIPLVPPAGAQVCGLPAVGTGTGVAI
jgi:hypothetical protein